MLRQGDEPIPGYRLERFLGRGQFGDVWQASAPGGMKTALKFIDLSGKQGLKEFRGIQRVKGIHHSHLMPITAIWMLDAEYNVLGDKALAEFEDLSGGKAKGLSETLAVDVPRPATMVVAMLPADQSLLARLEEEQGRGIPLAELLEYMEQAAKGLDFLNSPRHDLGEGLVGIQHCDIKPANILLVGDSVQICDFGLARVLEDTRATNTMPGSPAYIAPECIEANAPSHATDQYSLAITYYELRTGELPFSQEDRRAKLAILQAHLQGRLDFSLLPEGERQVIARATSLDPSRRFPSNMEMVRALARVVANAGGPEANSLHLAARSTPLPRRTGVHVADTEAAPSTSRSPSAAETHEIGRATSRANDTHPEGRSTESRPAEGRAHAGRKKASSSFFRPIALVSLLLLTSGGSWFVWISVGRPLPWGLKFPGASSHAGSDQLAEQFQNLIVQGNYEGALSLLKEFPQKEYDHRREELAESWLGSARTQMEQGQPQAALASCRQVLQHEELPVSGDYWPLVSRILSSMLTAAETHLAENHVDLAQRQFNQVLSQIEQLPPERRGVQWAAADVGRIRAAVQLDPGNWAEVATKLDRLQPDIVQGDDALRARYLALRALCEDPQDLNKNLPRLRDLAMVPDWQARLDRWEAEQIETRKGVILERLSKLERYAPTQMEMIRSVWPGGVEAELVLAQADALRRNKDFAGCRQLLDEAAQGTPAKPLQDRILVLRAVVSWNDPQTPWATAAELTKQAAPLATPGGRLDLCSAIVERADTDPDLAAQPSLLEPIVAAVRQLIDAAGADAVSLAPLARRLLIRRLTLALVGTQAAAPDKLLTLATDAWTPENPHPIVAASLVECQLAQPEKLTSTDWINVRQLSQRLTEPVPGEPAQSWADYLHYVRALVAYSDPLASKTATAADELQAAASEPVASGAMLSPWRRNFAALIMNVAATRLRQVGDEDLSETAYDRPSADRAQSWLNTALQLSENPTKELLANFCMASLYSSAPDFQQILEKSDPLLGDKLQDVSNAPAQLLLANATARRFWLKGKDGGPETTRAILVYAALWDRWKTSRNRRAADSVFKMVVAPGLSIVPVTLQTATSVLGERKSSVAKIYAAKGQLIREHLTIHDLFSEKAEEEAYTAYRIAALLDPRADYLVGEGLALINLSGKDSASKLTELSQLADAALAADPRHAGAHGLKGSSLVHLSRQEVDPQAVIQRLSSAVAHYDQAIQISGSAGSDYAGYLTGRSTAQLEWAFHVRFLPGQGLPHLQKAAEDAQQATEITPRQNPDHAWIAWGNAEEDMALYHGQLEKYDSALARFTQAVYDADESGGLRSYALLNLGRCQYRRAMYGKISGLARVDDLRQALSNLKEVAATSRQPSERAESRIWICDACQALAQLDKSDADNLLADAESACAQAAAEARNLDPLRWPQYQFKWAQLALQHLLRVTQQGADAAEQKAAREEVFRRTGELLAQADATSGTKIDPQYLAGAVQILVAATPDLEGKIKAFADNLSRFSEENPVQLPRRVTLLLDRSQVILACKPAEWKVHRRMCGDDAEAAYRLAEKLSAGPERDAFKSRAAGLLGLTYRKNVLDPSLSTTPQEELEVARRGVDRLNEAIALSHDLVGSVSWRYYLAGLYFQMLGDARYALSSAEKSQLKDNALQVIAPVLTANEPGIDEEMKRQLRVLHDKFTTL